MSGAVGSMSKIYSKNPWRVFGGCSLSLLTGWCRVNRSSARGTSGRMYGPLQLQTSIGCSEKLGASCQDFKHDNTRI